MIGQHIGRIRIDGLLGEGGMGRVYRGFDEKLLRRVAVKSIHADRRLVPEARARFLREARILSMLNHPNICQVYDLVEAEGMDFLVLELVEGRSLADHIEGGEIPATDRLEVAEKIALALETAHNEGIVHRDLKPENVMITGDGVVKVFDFGIARSLTAVGGEGEERAETTGFHPENLGNGSLVDLDDATLPGRGQLPRVRAASGTDDQYLTTEGVVLGTIRYMSPEQASGVEVAEASDLYAFGILLHELFTGRMPYPECGGHELLVKVAAAEVELDEALPGPIFNLVEDLTNLDPGKRPNAVEARRRLSEYAELPAARRRRRRNWVLGSISLVVLLAAVFLTYMAMRPALLVEVEGNAAVAVFPCVDATTSGANQWVELGLADLIAGTLRATDGIDVIPLTDITQALSELEEDAARDLDAALVNRVIRIHGADIGLTVTVSDRGEGYRVGYRLNRPQRRPIARSFEVIRITDAAEELARRLSVRLVPQAQLVAVGDRLTAHPDAARTYAMGVQRLETGYADRARHYFEVCLDIDAEFIWARWRLAKAVNEVGAWDEGQELLNEVLEDAENSGDGQLLAAVLLDQGWHATRRADYPAAQAWLERALVAYEELGDEIGVVGATDHLALTCLRTGDLERAAGLWALALEGARRSGSLRQQAMVLNNLGLLARQEGEIDAAEIVWAESLELQRQIGYRSWQGTTIGNLAMVARLRGDIDRATRLYSEALEIHRELGNRNGEALTLFNLAEATEFRGGRADARVLFAESLEISEVLGNRMLESFAHSYLSNLATEALDFNEAERHSETALQQAREINNPAAIRTAESAVFLFLLATDRLEEAAALADMIDPDSQDANELTALARYEYKRGRHREARVHARKALDLPDPLSVASREIIESILGSQ